MDSVGIDIVLFLFGAVFLCIGLYGRIETQWFKIGSDSWVMRASSGVIGTLLVIAALMKAEILPFGETKGVPLCLDSAVYTQLSCSQQQKVRSSKIS
jgi:hypothetical protein